MSNQFNQKLLPFSDWIKAGNVLQQAQESGISFEADITQDGFNTGQIELIQSGTESFTNGDFDRTVFFNDATINPVYLEGIGVVISNILGINPTVRMRAGGTASLQATNNLFSFDQVTPIPAGIVFPYFSSSDVCEISQYNSGLVNAWIPINKYVFMYPLILDVTLQLDRLLGVGESFDVTAYLFAKSNKVNGLKIVSP